LIGLTRAHAFSFAALLLRRGGRPSFQACLARVASNSECHALCFDAERRKDDNHDRNNAGYDGERERIIVAVSGRKINTKSQRRALR
jgi:hypothetical protein